MTQDYVQPTMPKQGYSFVLAGNLYKCFSGYGVYIKYKGGPNRIKIKHSHPRYLWLECPDRELVIVDDANSHDGFYPYGDSFDEFVSFSTYSDSVCKGMEFDYVMTNYAHSANSVKNPRVNLRTSPDSRVQFLSDSGGLQLVRGTTEPIHPIDLIDFYNNNVDAGMVLDIPLHVTDMDLCKRSAKLQRKNTDIMLKYSKGVELINIFHGRTVKERKVFKSIVEDSRVQRVALAASSWMNPLDLAGDIVTSLDDSFHYKQYHLLGVYKAALLPLLIKAANCPHSPRHITSDSTSHIQSAANKTYHHQFDIFHMMQRIPIGTRGSLPSSNRYLPCQCPVCTTIKYSDVLSFFDNQITTELLALHNAYEMARYTRQLQEICIHEPHEKYVNLIKTQLEKHRLIKDVLEALKFLHVRETHGSKAAFKRYESELKKEKFTVRYARRSLFEDRDGVNATYDDVLFKAQQLDTQIRAMTKQIEKRN